ncbi:MAG: ExbD/TolR family protein [Planctomycetia bacterium]
MARAIDQGEDTVLNMTPMIDVCFQLIVFFMLTLKFPSASSRFESQLPKDRGQASSPAVLTPIQDISVKLFRKDTEKDKTQHFTRVRVGETTTVDLPRGPWPLTGDEEEARRVAEDKLFAQVTEAIKAAWSHQQNNPEVKGEIKTPPPTGQLVPHGDVMRVLDAFVAAGISAVNFEGAPPPLLSKEGGGWDLK